MYREARKAGVPLADQSELEALGRDRTIEDLELSLDLTHRFNEYRKVGPKGGEIKKVMKEHLRWYWRWRLHVGERLPQLPSVQAASAQDREDLLASEQDFRRDIAQAIKDCDALAYRKQHPVATAIGDASVASAGVPPNIPVLSEAESIVLNEQSAKLPMPALVSEFFDQHVHDSHASFYLVGPTSALERKQLIASVINKQMRGEPLNGYERRVAALQTTRPGQLPTVSDAETADLLARESIATRVAVRLMTATRRESDGHVRERVIFDRS